jgi:hypothetical protein
MWPTLIALLIDRAAAGFPVLSELIRRRKADIVALAEAEPPAVAAAPAELKEAATAFLRRLQERATGRVLKFAIGTLISLLPLLADSVWDELLPAATAIQGRGPAVMASHPTDPLSPAERQAAEAFAACCEALA